MILSYLVATRLNSLIHPIARSTTFLALYFSLSKLLSLVSLLLVGILVAIIAFLLAALVAAKFGRIWIQARSANADVSILSLVGMSFRGVEPATIVTAQVIVGQVLGSATYLF